MAESIVQDWLADYQRVQGQPDEVTAFAVEHERDSEIADAIYTIFSDRQRHENLLYAICQQLLAFYRSSEESLRKFSVQFTPVLIFTYLQGVAAGDKKGVRCVETLLICIYNSEVSNSDGGPRVISFRMPLLAQPSIYHEERNLQMADLRRWEEHCNREVKWGPHPQVETITAQNRLGVMTVLLFCYNQQISQIQKSTLIHLCRVSSQLVNQGFGRQSDRHANRVSYSADGSSGSLLPQKHIVPRIPLSSAFLVELAHAIYYAMYHGFGTVAIQTLEDIHQRGCFEMYPELLLVTNAVRNSLRANPSGQPSDGPMGLSVALTPPTNTVTTATVSKSMITNASFRTKKLPDDIPIQVQDLTMIQAPPQALASVAEEIDQGSKEKEQQSTRNSIIRPSMEGIKAQAHKALIAGFKKTKDKEKEKEKDGNKPGSGGAGEPPKPPQRKFDKHTQRNSLLQMQTEATANVSIPDYEHSPTAVLKVKPFDALDTIEMVPIQSLLIKESCNDDITNESELNGGQLTSNTSNASSDMLTKSFSSSIELPSVRTGGITSKITDGIVD